MLPMNIINHDVSLICCYPIINLKIKIIRLKSSQHINYGSYSSMDKTFDYHPRYTGSMPGSDAYFVIDFLKLFEVIFPVY